MPALVPPALILVTGANGFAATHITAALLARGFRVRGTVRSAEKGEALVALYKSDALRTLYKVAPASSTTSSTSSSSASPTNPASSASPTNPASSAADPAFSYVIVRDIADADAWELDGVDGIAHVAAPIEGKEGEAVEFWLKPAVEGTLGLLRAAKASATVKRIVIIGTTASVIDFDLKPVAYTAADWNDAAIRELEAKGEATSAWLKYCASKTLSERAVWDFVKSEADTGTKLSFDVSYVLPSWIYGPVLLKIESPEKLVMSLRLLHGHFASPKLDDASLAAFSGSFSDARDVARAFCDAFARAELGGKRIIQCSPTHPTVQELYDAWDAIPLDKRPKLPFEVPRGKPGVDVESRKGFPTFVTSEKELGWKFRTLSETLKDTFASFVQHGLV